MCQIWLLSRTAVLPNSHTAVQPYGRSQLSRTDLQVINFPQRCLSFEMESEHQTEPCSCCNYPHSRHRAPLGRCFVWHCHRNYRNRFLTLNRTTAWELWIIGIFYWLTLLLSESLYWVQIPSSELNLQVVLIDIYQKKWSLYKNRWKISCPIPVKCQIGCLETVTEKSRNFKIMKVEIGF